MAEARKALALDSSLTVAHYMLGALLARQKMDEEALRHLRLGADASPQAPLEIAKVLQSTGDRNGAAQELRLYLQSGDGTYKNDAQRWLNTLR